MNSFKWLCTTGLIVSAILRAIGYHVSDMLIGLFGTALWVYASYKEKDRALLTCNLFILLILMYGIYNEVV
jgi:hypothetical protein